MDQINKIPVFDWFFDLGDVYLTVLIKGVQDIKVPQHLLEKEAEIFIVGDVPTPHLTYNKEGVNSPMRFGDTSFNCFFPWDAIVRMGGESAVIQFAVDEAKNEDFSGSALNPTAKKSNKGKGKSGESEKKKSHLRVVK